MSKLKAACESLANAIVEGHSCEETAKLRDELKSIRDSLTPETLPKDLKDLMNTLPKPLASHQELSSEPGIYLISAPQHNLHYVGLAMNIRDRFHNKVYGHLTNTACRSKEVFAKDGWCIHQLKTIDRKSPDFNFQLSFHELLYHSVLFVGGRKLVNDESFLGRVGGGVGRPLIVCCIDDESYLFFGSLSLACEVTGSEGLPAVVNGYQYSAAGYAARWASDKEIAKAESIASSHTSRRSELVLQGDDARKVTALDDPKVLMSGAGRNATVCWEAGLLTPEALKHLRDFRRGKYKTDPLPASGFRDVSWHSRSRAWQCRAKRGPNSKDIWQTSKKGWTAQDAADFRAKKILREGWQAWN